MGLHFHGKTERNENPCSMKRFLTGCLIRRAGHEDLACMRKI